jgi:hypothetical protein
MLRKYSKKGLEKRRSEREGLPEFFKKHIDLAKSKNCEECGTKLRGDVSEIAHVLPKQYFKSIMRSDNNVLYLCGMYSHNQCHSNFDNWSAEKIKEMKIFPKVQQLFKELQEDITENINYKIYDKYE